jgi:hypothetical protein
MREQWGCVAPTEQPQFCLECEACGGTDAACPACKGKGEIDYHRCPNALVEDSHWSAVRGLVLAERGLLPAAGGWADQAGSFLDALQLLRREQVKIEEKARKDRKGRR